MPTSFASRCISAFSTLPLLCLSFQNSQGTIWKRPVSPQLAAKRRRAVASHFFTLWLLQTHIQGGGRCLIVPVRGSGWPLPASITYFPIHSSPQKLFSCPLSSFPVQRRKGPGRKPAVRVWPGQEWELLSTHERLVLWGSGTPSLPILYVSGEDSDLTKTNLLYILSGLHDTPAIRNMLLCPLQPYWLFST